MINKKNRTDKESVLRKIINKIRYGMVLQVINNRIERLGIIIKPYYLFLEGLNYAQLPEIKENMSDYHCEFLGPDDMKAVAKGKTGLSENDYLSFLSEGQKCLAVKYRDDIAAFMWINVNEFRYKEVAYALDHQEAYLWNMFTMEPFRGMNLAPYLRYKSYEMLQDMGRNKLYSISEYFNTPAINFKKKLNARITKLQLYINLFKKHYWNITLKQYKTE
jgi:hypothetical protein